ncbi:MAG: DUF465 domain-containing protein [Nitrospirae bacterium]|nr:DUF465 domain-containing protein [Nitrospirota bacterium]
MSDESSALREELRKRNSEFRKLEGEHHRLELELNELIRRKMMTPQEALHKKQVQVEKLHMKDRIEAMLRRHRERHPTGS